MKLGSLAIYTGVMLTLGEISTMRLTEYPDCNCQVREMKMNMYANELCEFAKSK
jgi:hypothetical protein